MFAERLGIADCFELLDLKWALILDSMVLGTMLSERVVMQGADLRYCYCSNRCDYLVTRYDSVCNSAGSLNPLIDVLAMQENLVMQRGGGSLFDQQREIEPGSNGRASDWEQQKTLGAGAGAVLGLGDFRQI